MYPSIVRPCRCRENPRQSGPSIRGRTGNREAVGGPRRFSLRLLSVLGLALHTYAGFGNGGARRISSLVSLLMRSPGIDYSKVPSEKQVYGLSAAFVNLGRMFGPYGTQKRSAVVRSRTVHGYAPEIRRLFFVACLDYAAVKSSTVRGSRAYGFAIFLYSLPNVWSYAMEKSRS